MCSLRLLGSQFLFDVQGQRANGDLSLDHAADGYQHPEVVIDLAHPLDQGQRTDAQVEDGDVIGNRAYILAHNAEDDLLEFLSDLRNVEFTVRVRHGEFHQT